MKTMIDVRQILKRFGIFIYTGSRQGDLTMIAAELNELHKMGFITTADYQMARLIINREERLLKEEK